MEKSVCVHFVIFIWTILVCLVTQSSAGGRGGVQFKGNTEPEEKKSILCYKCNSAYDPNCGDPFEPFTIGLVNCSLIPKPEHLDPNITSTICRKTIQKVYGKVRVVRDCGYIRDEERDDKECVRRTGTHDVFVFYCSCTKSLCNSGYNLHVSHPILLIAIFTIAIQFLFTMRTTIS